MLSEKKCGYKLEQSLATTPSSYMYLHFLTKSCTILNLTL